MNRDDAIIENQNLIYFVLKKIGKYNQHEELFDIGMIGLIKGVDTYNKDKNVKLSSYLYKCILNELTMYFRRQQAKCRQATTVSLNEEILNDGINVITLENHIASNVNVEDEIQQKLLLELLEEKYQTLNKKEKIILDCTFELHGKKKLTQLELCSVINCTQSQISRIKSNAIKKLKEGLKEYV